MAKLAILMFVLTPFAFGQIVHGPAAGSIPAGVLVTTDAFAAPVPSGPPRPAEEGIEENEDEEELPSGALLSGKVQASTYVFDSSVIAPPSYLPPVKVAAFPGIGQTETWPPDPQVAAGPEYIVQAVNRAFRICDKSGTPIKDISIVQWYSTTVPGITVNNVFDPTLRYDYFAGRWVMAWLYLDQAKTLSYYLLSVSDDDNPLGTWSNWALPADLNGSTPSGDWADFHCVGFDAQAYYIVSDQRAYSSNYQRFDKIRIIPKSQLLANVAGPVSWSDFWNLRDSLGIPVHVRPSVVYGFPGEYYLMDIPKAGSGNHATVFRILSPVTTPSMTSVRVPIGQWTAPPRPDQYNSGNLIDDAGSGPKLQSAVVYRDSALWAVHTVANPGSTKSSCLRYLKISTATNSVLEDVTFGAPGYFYFYPTIAVDRDENVVITFSRCGTTEYIGAFLTWRLASDPPNTLRPSLLMHKGEAFYVPNGPPRWGDYMGACVDAADGNIFWLMTEYAVLTSGGSAWGTSILQLRLVPFPGPKLMTAESTLNFGWSEVSGLPDTLALTLHNVGSSTLTISGVTHTNPDYDLAGNPSFPVPLSTYQGLTIRVVFSPSALGASHDTLIIASTDPGRPLLKIPVSGIGVHAAPADPLMMYLTAYSPSGGTVLGTASSYVAPHVIGAPGMLGFRSLAIQPSTMQLYGIVSDFGFTSLYRIDCTNGIAFLARRIPVPDIGGIAFGRNDSLFCGTSSGILYHVRLSSGDTVRIGRTPGLAYAGLSFSPVSGSLWASAGSPYVNDSIYSVTPGTGIATAIGSTGFAVRTSSLAFDSAGALFGLVENALVYIDTLDGHATLFPRLIPFEGLRAIALRGGISTGVRNGADDQLPVSFRLEQNFPNPFNPNTVISYQLSVVSSVRLVVYDILGQEVAILVNGRQAPGNHEVTFDGRGLSSGVYVYRIQTGSNIASKKMVLMK